MNKNIRSLFATTFTLAAFISGQAIAQTLVISTNPNATTDDCAMPLNESERVEINIGSELVAEIDSDPLGCLNSGAVSGGVTLNALPYSDLEVGDPVTLTWSVPEDLTCTLRKNGETIIQNNGLQTTSQRIEEVDVSTTFQITCLANKVATAQIAPGVVNASATAIVDVMGSTGQAGEACSPVRPGPGFNKVDARYKESSGFSAPTLTSAQNLFTDLFGAWGSPSPRVRAMLRNRQYASLQFTTPAAGGATETSLTWDQVDDDPNNVEISIATCYGAPTEATAISERCYKSTQGSNGQFFMITGSSGNPNFCVLQPNTTYFLNYSFSNPYNASDSNDDHVDGCDNGNSDCFWNVKQG